MAVWSSSSDNRAQIKQQRERESRGEGSEGIRLRDKAAGAGCLAGSRSYCALVFPETLGSTSIQPVLALLFFFLHFSKVDRHHKVIFTILDCCFATIVLVLIYLPWHCCRDGGLLEELPLSAFCLQKEG